MKKVNILLSTYNGEKYIQEQMESLLKQDYDNYEIHVRDDGSTDNTIEILKKYVNQYPDKIFLYAEDNVGYKRSFQWLMQHCNDADYFSFCDQDDYWYENKLSRAVSLLEKENNQKPCVYLCDFFWCNSNMERERQNKGYQKYHSLEKYVTLGDRNAFGFTEVFNRNALESVMDNNSFEGCSHDEIIYMYCLCNGNVIWDDMVCADYRRHGDNASKLDLVGGNKFTHFLWRIKTFLLKSSKEQSYERMAVFYDNFKDDLNRESRNVFELYLGNKKRVKKTFMVKRYRDSIVDEICIRILFLLGRV